MPSATRTAVRFEPLDATGAIIGSVKQVALRPCPAIIRDLPDHPDKCDPAWVASLLEGNALVMYEHLQSCIRAQYRRAEQRLTIFRAYRAAARRLYHASVRFDLESFGHAEHAILQIVAVLDKISVHASAEVEHHLRLDLVAWQIVMNLRKRLPIDFDSWKGYLGYKPLSYGELDTLYLEGTTARREAQRLLQLSSDHRLRQLRDTAEVIV